ncbi:MAG: response regulator transcription factor [Pseudomonas sp.]|nr:MAG: response regulator transcription factor [Pseudomonas sp.]
MIEVGIVEDHPITRLALRELFKIEEDIHLAGEAKDGSEALKLVCEVRLQVLILDIDLPNRSGLDILKQLRRHAPEMHVVVFTNYPEDQYALNLFRIGASAYIPKSSDLEVLLSAVRGVASGKRWILPSQAELLASTKLSRSNKLHESLSHREMQVLLKLARGVDATEIAENLMLSAKSISTYRTRLLRKLDVASNGELTYYALKHNLLD